MNQEEIARGRSKNGKRGSQNTAKRLDAFRKKAEGHRGADWGGVNPDEIAYVVVSAQNLGGAVTFGLSRDGGAYMVTLLLDGDKETLWFNGDADIETELHDVGDALSAMRD